MLFGIFKNSKKFGYICCSVVMFVWFFFCCCLVLMSFPKHTILSSAVPSRVPKAVTSIVRDIVVFTGQSVQLFSLKSFLLGFTNNGIIYFHGKGKSSLWDQWYAINCIDNLSLNRDYHVTDITSFLESVYYGHYWCISKNANNCFNYLVSIKDHCCYCVIDKKGDSLNNINVLTAKSCISSNFINFIFYAYWCNKLNNIISILDVFDLKSRDYHLNN